VTVASENAYQSDIAVWIHEHLARPFPVDDRSQMALACFDLAIEHHAAICALSQGELFGSMYALLRVEFEAFARGLWIRHAANDGLLLKYREDKMRDFGIAALIESVENRLGMKGSALSTIKTKHWDIFCSFTHTGYQALVRRVNETHTGPVNYQDKEVITGLRFAGLVALLSAVELASMTGEEALVNMALDKARGYETQKL